MFKNLWLGSSQRYAAVDGEDTEHAHLNKAENSIDEGDGHMSPMHKRRRRVGVTAGLLFFMTTTILLLGVNMVTSSGTSQAACHTHDPLWSPANDAIEYYERDWDNAFAHDTIYRGPPTPELEYAWEKLWRYDAVRIPEDKLHLLNRTVELNDGKLVETTDEPGGYRAAIDMFHQLHCLNLVRQYTWRAWYLEHKHIVQTPIDMRDSDVGARMHVDHCIEALRLAIMCHGDTTPYFVLKDASAPFKRKADFSAHHKCRNFERIRDWTTEHQLLSPKPLTWDPNVQMG